MPALPLHEAGAYVAGAYVLFLVLLALYVGIMSRHVAHVREEVRRLGHDSGDDR